MTPEQQQQTAALMLLKDLAQMSIMQMPPALSEFVAKGAQQAANLLSQLINQPEVPKKKTKRP